jgi:hypothetical protein
MQSYMIAETLVSLSLAKSSIISRKDSGDTPTYAVSEQVCIHAQKRYFPQKRYINHVYLFHARPETPIYILEFETQNNIEVLIRHDRF